MAELEKCIKCNKNTENEDIINYNVPIIWGKDKDGERIKKIEGGNHCLDCWKKVEKDYRWWYVCPFIDITKKWGWRFADNVYFDWKKNRWCSTDEGKFDPDVPIDPNDKLPNYWLGCLICDWERELKDDERGGFMRGDLVCKKCHKDQIDIYPAHKRKNKHNNNDRRDEDNDENNPEKLLLEQQIASFQQALKALKQIPKNHPGYNEYQKQQLEKQLTEAKEKYKGKYGKLPNSLNGNDKEHRERERANSTITNSDCWIRSYS